MIVALSARALVRADADAPVLPRASSAVPFAEVIAARAGADAPPATAAAIAADAPAEPPPAAQAEALIARLAGMGDRPPAPAGEAEAAKGSSTSAPPAGEETPTNNTAIDEGTLPAPAEASPDAQPPTTSGPPLSSPAQITVPIAIPVAPVTARGSAAASDGATMPARQRSSAAVTGQLTSRAADGCDDAGDAASAQTLSPMLTGSVFTLPSLANSQTVVPAPADAIVPALQGEVAIEHHLDLAQDHVWLDQLAQDISRSADPNGRLRFVLAPEHLGRMTVDLAAGADGTSVRLTTESEQARRIVSDAQPRLMAEAQAQGMRITETQVALDHRSGGSPHRDATASASSAMGAGPGGQGGSTSRDQNSAGAQNRPAPKRATAGPSPAVRHLYA